MFKSKLHIYSRILIALVAAILVSDLLTREVFIGATPRVRPDLADRIVESSLALVNKDTYVAFFNREESSQSILQELAAVPATQIAKGVYAKESENASYIEVRPDEADFQNISYTKKDGSVITIAVPNGTEPPPPGLF